MNPEKRAENIDDKRDHTGVFINYKLGQKRQTSRKGIIEVLDVNQEDWGKVVGWWVGWPEKQPRLFGRIMGFHGNSGLLVYFKKGLPGKAIGNHVVIMKGKKLKDSQITVGNIGKQ